jgi:predicted Zn-dependent protease
MSGLKYMTAGGYNPQGMVQLMTVLQKSGGGGAPEFLSTHPNPGNRLQYLSSTIEKRYAPMARTGRLGEDEFRRNVLSRRSTAHAPIDFADPSPWCGTCRENQRRVAAMLNE